MRNKNDKWEPLVFHHRWVVYWAAVSSPLDAPVVVAPPPLTREHKLQFEVHRDIGMFLTRDAA